MHNLDMIGWNTIFTGVIALLAALLGALVGARATKGATTRGAELAWENERKRQDLTQRAAVRRFLLAIRAELGTIWEGYVKEVVPYIEAVQSGQPLRFVYRLRQNYFTVYETNCHLVGEVLDDELRNSIVKTYVLGKGLIDEHLINNDLNDNYDERVGTVREAAALEQLRTFYPRLKETYEQTKTSVEELIRLIDSSDLITQPAEPKL